MVMLSPHPNPFTRTVALNFTLPRVLPVTARVFDAEGRLVRSLAHETSGPGHHLYTWDGRDGRGVGTASGSYYVDVQAGDTHERRKVVWVR